MSPKIIYTRIYNIGIIIAAIICIVIANATHTLIDTQNYYNTLLFIMLPLIIIGALITCIFDNSLQQWLQTDKSAIVLIGCFTGAIAFTIGMFLILFNESFPQTTPQTFNGSVYFKLHTDGYRYNHDYVDLLINNATYQLDNKQLFDNAQKGDQIKLTVQKGYFGWYYELQLEDDMRSHFKINL